MSSVLLGLTACGPTPSGPTPGPSTSASALPSGTPTVAPTPVVSPAAVIVDRDSVSVVDAGSTVIIDIPFSTDPATAVSQLNDAIDLVGTSSTLPAASCFHERQKMTWGGLSFIWGDDWQRAPGALFLASVSGPESASGIAVTIPSGQSVGSSGPGVLAANPSAHYDDFGSWIGLHYDVATGAPATNPDAYYGGYALIEGGILKSFSSPINYEYDC